MISLAAGVCKPCDAGATQAVAGALKYPLIGQSYCRQYAMRHRVHADHRRRPAVRIEDGITDCKWWSSQLTCGQRWN